MSPEDEEKKEPEEQDGAEGEAPKEPEGAEGQAAPEGGEAGAEQAPPEEGASAGGGGPFENLTEEVDAAAEAKKIDFLYDVELDVNIELGRAELKVRDILSLQSGSVVELNRLAGDPVDIIVNKRLVARGEVIVIDENFAVRVTDILSPAEIVSSISASH